MDGMRRTYYIHFIENSIKKNTKLHNRLNQHLGSIDMQPQNNNPCFKTEKGNINMLHGGQQKRSHYCNSNCNIINRSIGCGRLACQTPKIMSTQTIPGRPRPDINHPHITRPHINRSHTTHPQSTRQLSTNRPPLHHLSTPTESTPHFNHQN